MTPSTNPFTVRADASGRPTPFTIEATGFEPGTHVYVEQCDGTSPDSLQWSPTIDCDLGTSPAAAVAGSDGSVVFDASDPNLSFHPFRGESPEGLFNCLGVDQASLNNGLLNSRDCAVRVSTSNSAPTSDQLFLGIALPAPRSSSPATTTPTPHPAPSTGTGAASGSRAGAPGVTALSGSPTARVAGRSTGRLALTGRWSYATAVVGLECIALGLAWSRRRRRSVAGSEKS